MHNGSQIRQYLWIWKIVNNCQYSTVAVQMSSSLWLCWVPSFVLNDLYMYIIFFILQYLKKFPKNWMTRRNVLTNLPHYYLFLVFLHQFCETYSTEQLETLQYGVEHFFGSDQYKCLQNIRVDCLPRPDNSDVISQIFKTLYNIIWQ